MSKNYQKLEIFSKKFCQNFLFLSKNCHWQFLAIFLEKMSSFWQFFDSQIAILRRVSYPPLSRLCLSTSALCTLCGIAKRTKLNIDLERDVCHTVKSFIIASNTYNLLTNNHEQVNQYQS